MRAFLRSELVLAAVIMLAACGEADGTDLADAAEPAEGDGGADDRADAATPIDATVEPVATDAGTTRDAASAAVEAGTRDAASDARVRDVEMPAGSADAAAPTGPSAGCGKPAQANGDFARRTVSVMNRERSYHVRLPDDYDPMRPYPLIFRFHGSGGDGLSGGLGIEFVAGDAAIVVGPDGLNQGWSAGSEASDLAFFDAMYDALSAAHCVDLGRVFAYGFSMGGGMSNALGCKRSDKLRAIAPIAGFDRGTGSCARSVAAWLRHDVGDGAVPIAQGRGARDRLLSRNHCSTRTSMTADGCLRYEGCDEGFPVVWCETMGLGHEIAGDEAPEQVWQFFSGLR